MQEKNKFTILVIDSGIGGMSIVKQLRELSQEICVIYLSDNEFFPYGNKNPDSLLARLRFLVSTIVAKYHVDAIVIGCNTATVLLIDKLRKCYDLPFIGVVPPLKTAAATTSTGNIVIIATQNTVDSGYLDRLVKDFASHCYVSILACPGLADIAEDKINGHGVCQARLKACIGSLSKTTAKDPDVVVLGCTHYSFIKEELKIYFGPGIEIIEPSLPVAKQVLNILNSMRGADYDELDVGKYTLQNEGNRFFLTKKFQITDDMKFFLKKHGFPMVEFLHEHDS